MFLTWTSKQIFFLFPLTSPKNPCRDPSNIEYSENALIVIFIFAFSATVPDYLSINSVIFRTNGPTLCPLVCIIWLPYVSESIKKLSERATWLLFVYTTDLGVNIWKPC